MKAPMREPEAMAVRMKSKRRVLPAVAMPSVALGGMLTRPKEAGASSQNGGREVTRAGGPMKGGS